MTGRRLSAEERMLWARVVASVAPLAGKPLVVAPPVSSEVEGRGTARARPDQRASTSLGTSDEARARVQSNTLDGSWDRRLSRGDVQPELAIDLHGHTLETAYRTLDAGLDQAIARSARVLLLVTGKPREAGAGRGKIRAAVGDWLAASRHCSDIAAVRGAHPRHGGTGALYIVLRRRRENRTS